MHETVAHHDNTISLHASEQDQAAHRSPATAPKNGRSTKCTHARHTGGGLRAAVLGEQNEHADRHDANDVFDLKEQDGAALCQLLFHFLIAEVQRYVNCSNVSC